MRDDLAVCGVCGTEGTIHGIEGKFDLTPRDYDWGVVHCNTCGAELHFDPWCYLNLPAILGGEEWSKADE